MARIRTIKPEFWTNESLSELPEAVHLLAAALLNYADDFGYFNANPTLILAACSPLRTPSVGIPESLQSLSEVGYITLGVCPKGRHYGLINNFTTHQKVSHPTASKISVLPITWNDSGAIPENSGKVPESFAPEGKGTGKGKEQGTGKGNDAAASNFSELFTTLWDSWPTGYGDKGSRKQAEIAFLKLKPDKPLFATMLRALDAQGRDKRAKALAGQFAAPFQHVERWIKNRRWEDEISQLVNGSAPKQSASDKAFAEFLASQSVDDCLDAGDLEGHALIESH